jgi:RHS repeat-associated protein
MTRDNSQNGNGKASSEQKSYYSPPAAVELPKGGGALRGIGEKFSVNPVTGTGSLTVPIFATPSRSNFYPQLSLSYDSGSGNGLFGLGWNLSVPSVSRKTDKGLPRYFDGEDSDVFILSGAEDLVPVLILKGGDWVQDERTEGDFTIRRYRPRIEGLFARIERWQDKGTGAIHWRSLSKDNITSIYGRSPDLLHSQIKDPADDSRVFKWLLEASYDDRGNLIVYEYKPEDAANVDASAVQEGHRTEQDYQANVYLKRIWYGNRTPYRQATQVPALDYTDLVKDTAAQNNHWLFQVVFDYGEHGADDSRLDEGNWDGLIPADLETDTPTPDEDRYWPPRPDAFSTYRAGFEVRTQRLCRRVLMFQRMDEAGAIGADWHLVRSTDFGYEKDPVATYLVAAKQTGYVRTDGGYDRRWMPPLEMHYDRPRFDPEIKTVDPDSLENLPIGLDGSQYQWVDLDSEGISGVLTEQGTGWFYKRNLGGAEFGPAELVATKPSVAVLQSPQQRVMDLAGDGTQDIVLLGDLTGYYQREADGEWRNFQSFETTPNVDWNDPNLRFIDLNGDGHADILITQDGLLVWYPSRSRQGFGAAETVRKAQDEEQGPALVFADGTQSIYLADMSGDGLNDLVRIRNGEVCYWPSLGYGRFGARVTMAGAPWFDHPELFDQRRVRLADIDGSGTTDILYLGREEIGIWLNQAGNSFRRYGSEPGETPLTQFPTVDDLAAVQAIDLLGNGTACLVWSSPLPGQSQQPMRYIDLMGGQKPHLMTSVVNNLGAETKLQYTASTKFYLQDREEGNPWITRLPFPVHVVERVETIDHLTGNRFVSLYRYRHGYFDGEEREFRGFGYVEQWDTEAYAELAKGNLFTAGSNEEASSHVPPVYSKTWFHTGFYLDREHISQLFAEEYYQGDSQAVLLPDTILPAGLTAQEEREACRALKGSVLRQEVYALDGTAEAAHPYTVTESNYEIRQVQPRQDERHGVFFVHPRESLAYHYERNPEDPRVAHQMTLAVDGFGNVVKSAAIAYGRRKTIHVVNGQGEIEAIPNPQLSQLRLEDQRKQTDILITYTENQVTNKPDEADWYRIGLPVETRTYEITGLPEAATPSFSPFKLDTVRNQIATAAEIPYEATARAGIQKRVIEQVRTLYRANGEANTLTPKALPLGKVESLALPCESYKLAFTPGLLTQVYQRPRPNQAVEDLLPNPSEVLRVDAAGGHIADRGGYVQLDQGWWIPSGIQAFDPALFYLPTKTKDPFNQDYTLTYDAHALLVTQTADPLQNIVSNHNNYRVMQPWQLTDPNGNRAQVAFDTLGMVAGTAVMGKETENLGDSLDDFVAEVSPGDLAAFLADPLGTAAASLGTATTRILYDLERYQRSGQPVYAATLARESHGSDPVPPGGLKVQVSFLYSDGFGRELQTKIQAEPGDAPVRDAQGVLKCNENLIHTDPRWVGTGRKIYNNKGKPVKQYEPFFSPTHEYESEPGLVECGVTPIVFYDPLERVVATLHPNHTYEKVVFDPWQQATWDVNDTVTLDPSTDGDVRAFFVDAAGQPRLPSRLYSPTWYAQRKDGALGAQEQQAAKQAAIHGSTPTVAHLDTLGRTVLTVAHNGFDAAGKPIEYSTRVLLDIEGNQRSVTDAKDRIVMTYTYDLLGNRIHQASMEAGARWMLNDVAGKPIRAWDSRGHGFTTRYDELRRPLEAWVKGDDIPGARHEILFEKTEYGEGQAQALNLRTKVFRQWDGAGLVTNAAYDFKGNLLRSQRQLVEDYHNAPDWQQNPTLEEEIFESRTVYDALNRPIQMVAPHDIQKANIVTDVIQPAYNEANLLEMINVWLKHGGEPATLLAPPTADLPAVRNINYNAKGQRELIEYGNGVTTTYAYDPETFRLTRLTTVRANGGSPLQDLHYTYDPTGNITHIQDDAQQTIFFDNQRVEPHADYTYDAIYRLIEATGREHLGQKPNGNREPIPIRQYDSLRMNRPHPSDGQAMGRYRQQYVYDEVGNILEMIHRGTDPNNPGWSRSYGYEEDSLTEPVQGNQPVKKSNRLSYTRVARGGHQPNLEPYAHDAHGNMTEMPHLSVMEWDFQDQLQATARQVANPGSIPETTYYVYDAGGQRVRKVTERFVKAVDAANGQTPKRLKERIYLGGFEIYREYGGDGKVTLERETLHGMDDQQRIALVETKIIAPPGDRSPLQLIRYQIGNHLGSVSLELDGQGKVISYEEYYPYGSTSYQGVDKEIEAPKRYRYTGKERDEETKFFYHGARYYLPWLGSWASVDPAGLIERTNLYQFAKNNPTEFHDLTGKQSTSSKEWQGEVAASVGYAWGKAIRDDRYAKFVEPLSIRASLRAFDSFLGAVGHTVMATLYTGGRRVLELPQDLLDRVPTQQLDELSIVAYTSGFMPEMAVGAASGAISRGIGLLQRTRRVERIIETGEDIVSATARVAGGVEDVAGAATKVAGGVEDVVKATTKVEKVTETSKQVSKLLKVGRPGNVIANKLLKHELEFAKEIVAHRGGELIGAAKKSAPGIDAFLEGVPISLKQTKGGLTAVLRHASAAEAQAKAAGYKGVEVFIKAVNVGKTQLLDFALKGPLTKIPKQGIVSAINVLTKDGWTRFIPYI